MFKKRERPNSARSRGDADDGEAGAVQTAADIKKSRSGLTSSTNEGGRIAATSRRSDSEQAAKVAGREADAALAGLKANDARGPRPSDDITRTLDIDTAVGEDQRAIHERNLAIHKGLKDGSLDKGVYRGLGGYKKYLDPSEGAIAAAKYTGLLGPLRNTLSNVRTTIRVEYWNASSGTDGGICKDYKETGYCGFGDTCKYLHDRSDYKSGFQLDAEWEAKQKAAEEKKRRKWEKRLQKVEEGGDASDSSVERDDDDELPMECPKCSTAWESCSSVPIKTVCGHYFCEDCAMENFATSPKCMTCDAQTHGIFNSCDTLEERLKQRREAAKARKTDGAAGSATSGAGPSIGPFNIGLAT